MRGKAETEVKSLMIVIQMKARVARNDDCCEMPAGEAICLRNEGGSRKISVL
jgi:hypothetical protein